MLGGDGQQNCNGRYLSIRLLLWSLFVHTVTLLWSIFVHTVTLLKFVSNPGFIKKCTSVLAQS